MYADNTFSLKISGSRDGELSRSCFFLTPEALIKCRIVFSFENQCLICCSQEVKKFTWLKSVRRQRKTWGPCPGVRVPGDGQVWK